MNRENEILNLLEGKEAEADAKAEFVANYVEMNRGKLIAGEFEVDAATLLAELNLDEAIYLNQAIYLLMKEGEPGPMMQLVNSLVDEEMAAMADTAWGYHLAELTDAMSSEQWAIYYSRGDE